MDFRIENFCFQDQELWIPGLRFSYCNHLCNIDYKLCLSVLQNGLFDDIAEGLLSAKVVVICVSDDYAESTTCRIEFRYAANTLKLPIIMAVVGKGNKWRASEVGVLLS